ncbi:MAG: precorrin-6y C5,15-methyltransferase (decarboxylating) subunit CbiE [Polyangiales bacterium]
MTTVISTSWLSIVGLTAEGEAGLHPAARAAIAAAELVIGSERQLKLVAAITTGATQRWPSPLADGLPALWARRGRSTCVLASGDPFWYGIGATLAPQLAPGEFVCYPAPSSLSLAAARLGWALQDVAVVSLHGRDLHAVIPHLQPQRRVLALSWNGQTPSQLAALLRERGLGDSRLHVLEVLGGPEERVRSSLARDYPLGDVADLNVIGLEVAAERGAFYLPARGSLPDDAFEHDGQLTKRDIRAITLSALAPRPGALLWDVGAGSGSIAIEWLLGHPSCRAIAIERDSARAGRIRRNASRLGVPTLQLVEAGAPEGLAGLPTPDAVFIGGGASDPALFAHCWQALRPGGRLVINAVALATEALLLQWHAAHGGELCRIAVAHAEALGRHRGWRPAMPVTQWRVDKP